jgi:hypothetical protein
MRNADGILGLSGPGFIGSLKRPIFVFIVAAFVMLLPVLVQAQAVSGVTGVVTDSAGAVVPGVNVVLTDTKTSKELTTKTNDQGVYLFSNIPPGDGFKLSFSLQGFQTLSISGVALGVGKTETQNAELVAGQVSETVEVTSSNDVTLNTTDPSIGNIIDRRQLRELPIQIRNSPAALIGLQPGVIGNNVGTGATNRVGSVTGARTDQGNITIDGIDANDQATGQAFATVGNAPIDAIQEFRAVSTNPSSSEGRSSGGQIQLLTRSGSNDFHGSLRIYNRNDKFAANSFFNNRLGRYAADDPQVTQGLVSAGDLKAPRPDLKRNQFGGSLGGRIIRDKLFFFFDYEGRRDSVGVTYTRIVPLPHFRAGGLGYINNGPGCTQFSRINTQPACITVLTAAQVAARDPLAIGPNAALLSFINQRYPLPNDLTAGDGINTAGIRFNAPSKRLDNTYTTRLDWNINDAQHLFGRFNIARRNQTDTINSVAAQFPGDPESAVIDQKDYAWVVGHSWVINSALTNQATVGLTHSGLDFLAPFAPASPNQFAFGGLTAPFAGIDTQNRIIDTPTIRDDATWGIGNHTVLFGAQIKPIRSQSGIVNDFNNPTVGLGGNLTALNSTFRPANFLSTAVTRAAYDNLFTTLLGRYASIATNFNYTKDSVPVPLASGKMRDYRYNEYEFYVQDNWKIRSDLTLNGGVRWQFYPPPYEANGFQAHNDIDFRELFETRVRNAAAGIGGADAEPLLSYDLIGPKNGRRDIYKKDWNNFGPRVGFAWNPSFTDGILGKIMGDRKTVIRGGGSLVYDRVGGGITFIQDQVSYIFDGSRTVNFGSLNPTTSLMNDPRFTSINSLPVTVTAPVITRPFTPFILPNGNPDPDQAGQQNYTITQDFEIPYSYQWSIGFQRELPHNFMLDVSYVGRLGKRLFAQADTSQALNFRDPASGQFLFDAFRNVQREAQACGTSPTCTFTPQPWFENQVGPGGTDFFTIDFLREFARIGDLSDTVVVLYNNGLLDYNVGVSSQFATNSYITNLASSEYHGMLVSLQKSFSNGLQFDFNYTWSHAIDNQSSVTNTVFGGLLCDLNDLTVCRGNSDFDIRHLVNANFIYELPFGKGKAFGNGVPGWLDQIIGGWTFTGIYTYRSGLPFSTTTGSFPVGFLVDSPAVFSGNAGILSGNIRDVGPNIQFFNDMALNSFRNPEPGQTGNRNNLRGPSFWNADLALLKNFKMPWEGHRLQLRVEAYNAFNHHVFGLPAANVNDSTTFGRITTSSSAARELQFAARYDF